MKDTTPPTEGQESRPPSVIWAVIDAVLDEQYRVIPRQQYNQVREALQAAYVENERLRRCLTLREQWIKHLEHRNKSLEEANAKLEQRIFQHIMSLLQTPWKAVRHG